MIIAHFRFTLQYLRCDSLLTKQKLLNSKLFYGLPKAIYRSPSGGAGAIGSVEPSGTKISARFVKGSITNDIDLKRVFHEKPQFIFHLAAFFANQNSVDYPEKDLLVSQLGTVKMLEHAVLQEGIKRFVYAGSGCAIYGAQAPLPLKEEFVSMHLSTPYQISKMAGELYCNFYWHHYGLPIVKTRFFNSYGPGEVPEYRNVIPNFIYWAMKGQPLPITGDGKMTRDFTYVEDIVDALCGPGIREEAIGQEMNIASAAETEIVEMANTVNELTGNKAGLLYTDRRKWDTRLVCWPAWIGLGIIRLPKSVDLLRDSATRSAGLKKTGMRFKEIEFPCEGCL